MRLEEHFVVDAPIDRVWAFIMSPLDVGRCVPGCETVEVLEPDRYRAVIAVRVGPITARFNLDIEVVEQHAPLRAAFLTRGEEGGRASRLTASSTLVLESVDEQRTEVTYTSDVSVMGRMGTVGLGLMRSKARALGADFAGALRERIHATSSV